MSIRLAYAMKTASRFRYIVEGDDWGAVRADDEIWFVKPLSDIGSRRRSVKVHSYAFPTKSRKYNWLATLEDALQGETNWFRAMDKAQKILERSKEMDSEGAGEYNEYSVDGNDPGLPTPSIKKVPDIVSTDVHIFMNKNPIEVRSKSANYLINGSERTYSWTIPIRHKGLLNANRDLLAGVSDHEELKTVLNRLGVKYDYETTSPIW